MADTDSSVVDPFAHLHEEDFEQPYNHPRLEASSAFFTGGRKARSLDGDWHFVLDPFQEGLRQRWFEHDKTPIEDWVTPRDYDDGAWQTSPVPGCWNLTKPEWFHYEGAAWYSRRFEHDALKDSERVFLRLGAATGRCRVFLNGRFIGLHFGSSTPIFAELSDALIAGENLLMIEVDNSRRADAVPMHHFDWFNYGGLFREVSLFTLPKTFIKHFRLALAPDGKGIAVSVSMSAPVSGQADLVIKGLGAQSIAVSEGSGAMVLDMGPELWSPVSPKLYDVSLSFDGDVVRDRGWLSADQPDGPCDPSQWRGDRPSRYLRTRR
ncbi:sugar-binding domain-containing protein [uncultured Cohaesibacter sp.]|uniref:sugar-binding domain-containing protein n=1 Tax=uncultured Cohaesibacter sp. TaxID=1002546 RepID=UPI0029C97BBB|nr:sugar-binding domain-containing protein [uncultured Cohaesibacter sp.]